MCICPLWVPCIGSVGVYWSILTVRIGLAATLYPVLFSFETGRGAVTTSSRLTAEHLAKGPAAPAILNGCVCQ